MSGWYTVEQFVIYVFSSLLLSKIWAFRCAGAVSHGSSESTLSPREQIMKEYTYVILNLILFGDKIVSSNPLDAKQ